jgi:cyclophilin family peptidyl-prolyl cis-trans isomerase
MRPLALLAAAALALAACGGSSNSTSSSSAAQATTGGAAGTAAAPAGGSTGADGCDHTAPPTPSPKTYTTAPKPPFATEGAKLTMTTSCGVITFTLDHKLGGVVTDAVAGLAADGFYDGLTFHRVVPDFVLQGGDPKGDGTGGPGFTVTQAPPASYQYKLGDLAMAKTESQPDGTGGSQFFVISGSQGETLPPQYAVIGHATDADSLATIARIAALGVTDGPPSSPVYILNAKLEAAG